MAVDPLLRLAIWNHLHLMTAQDNTTIILSTHYIQVETHFFKINAMGSRERQLRVRKRKRELRRKNSVSE